MVLRSIDKCREVSIREAATLGGHNSCSECIVGKQEVIRFLPVCPSIALDQLQGTSPDGGSSPGYCPFEERARDLGRQTSTASTGRRGLAWADSLG